jgi:peptidoglycan/LPS O-acetylase OafA/YrhL
MTVTSEASASLVRSQLRPDIQALRAIAVMLVISYHVAPQLIPGGYVGVDVFFVISGYLMTSHLGRELLSTGKIRFRAFYLRRARRLLPMALLVLLVTLGAGLLFLPRTYWLALGIQIPASALYVENWALALN